MARKRITLMIGTVLLIWLAMHNASAQTAKATPQRQSVSLPHLYWHFLIYQNYLDTKAAALQAKGKNGIWIRNHLQGMLNLSDSDYVFVRTSSTRLASELQSVDAQASTIRSSAVSSSRTTQLQGLNTQREAYINAEIAYLRQSLSPAKIASFELFITQFFSPNKPAPQSAVSGSAVQQ